MQYLVLVSRQCSSPSGVDFQFRRTETSHEVSYRLVDGRLARQNLVGSRILRIFSQRHPRRQHSITSPKYPQLFPFVSNLMYCCMGSIKLRWCQRCVPSRPSSMHFFCPDISISSHCMQFPTISNSLQVNQERPWPSPTRSLPPF